MRLPIRAVRIISFSALPLAVLASGALAEELSDARMDQITAGGLFELTADQLDSATSAPATQRDRRGREDARGISVRNISLAAVSTGRLRVPRAPPWGVVPPPEITMVPGVVPPPGNPNGPGVVPPPEIPMVPGVVPPPEIPMVPGVVPPPEITMVPGVVPPPEITMVPGEIPIFT